MLLGDSIRLIGYGQKVEEMLKDRFEIWQPEDNCRFAKYTLRMLFDFRQDIENADVICRGYEDIVSDLGSLGANIRRLS